MRVVDSESREVISSDTSSLPSEEHLTEAHIAYLACALLQVSFTYAETVILTWNACHIVCRWGRTPAADLKHLVDVARFGTRFEPWGSSYPWNGQMPWGCRGQVCVSAPLLGACMQIPSLRRLMEAPHAGLDLILVNKVW